MDSLLTCLNPFESIDARLSNIETLLRINSQSFHPPSPPSRLDRKFTLKATAEEFEMSLPTLHKILNKLPDVIKRHRFPGSRKVFLLESEINAALGIYKNVGSN